MKFYLMILKIKYNINEMSNNIKNGIKYINKSKLQFVEHF